MGLIQDAIQIFSGGIAQKSMSGRQEKASAGGSSREVSFSETAVVSESMRTQDSNDIVSYKEMQPRKPSGAPLRVPVRENVPSIPPSDQGVVTNPVVETEDAVSMETSSMTIPSVSMEYVEETVATEPKEVPPVESEGIVHRNGSSVTFCLLAAFFLGVLLGRFCFRRRANPQTKIQLQQDQAAAADPVPASLALAPTAEPATGVRATIFQEIGARKDQQDSCDMTDPAAYAAQGVLALVADGMGGLANGKEISSELVNTFLHGFDAVSEYPCEQEILLDLAVRANHAVNKRFRNPERSGSTLVAVLLRKGYLNYLSVGDSRIYLFRNGALLQLNREHIFQEELALKAINREVPIAQVTKDRQAHALTSFFGDGILAHMDRNNEGIRLLPGDRILLCSDGVFGTLSQRQMEYALSRELTEAAGIMRDLIREINKPYQDNNTGLILEFLG